MESTDNIIEAKFAELNEKKTAIEEQTTPIREKRDALQPKIQKLLDEQEALSAEIKQIESDNGLVELCREIAKVARLKNSTKVLSEGN